MSGWLLSRDRLAPDREFAGNWTAYPAFRIHNVFVVFGVLVTGGVFLGSLAGYESLPWAPFIPLGLVAIGLAGWLVLAAACGSPMAIMLYFGALAFLTDAQFRVRGAGEISGDWQSALKFLVWMGAGIIGFAHMPSLRTLLAKPASACCLAYVIVALMSSAYSPVPGYSFGCALALLCLFAFSYSLTTRLSEAQLLWTLLLSLTAFNIGGWFVFFANPDLGTSMAWTNSGFVFRMCGLAGQANNLGMVCASAIGAAFVLACNRRRGMLMAVMLGAFAFITLAKSDSRTTEIAAIIGIAVVLASRSAWLVLGGILAAATGLLLLQLFPQLFSLIGNQFSRSGDPTELYTLTGRLEIWDFAREQIALSPIFGYGYNSSKVVLGTHIGFDNGLMVDSAHNLYLQSMLSVGGLGTIPLLGLLGCLLFKCFTRPVPIVCFILTLVLVSSISDTDTIGTTPTLMTLLFFVASIWPHMNALSWPRNGSKTYDWREAAGARMAGGVRQPEAPTATASQ